MSGAIRILVDADACPVKAEVARVAERYAIDVTLVAASWMRVPPGGRVTLEVVEAGFDAADDRIAALADATCIVVTADVPLAARCVAKGATVLAPDGRAFTEDNVGDALATRDLLAHLRGAGEVTGGPPPFGDRERSRFLQALDRAVHAVKRRGS